MSKFSAVIRGCASWTLGVYIVILGLLLIHPFVDSEGHHTDHVCQDDTHYHEATAECKLCSFTFPSSERYESCTIEEVIPSVFWLVYADLTTKPYGVRLLDYHQRGPPCF